MGIVFVEDKVYDVLEVEEGRILTTEHDHRGVKSFPLDRNNLSYFPEGISKGMRVILRGKVVSVDAYIGGFYKVLVRDSWYNTHVVYGSDLKLIKRRWV